MPLTRMKKVKLSTLSEQVNESPSSSSTMTSVLEAEAASWIHRADHPLMNDLVLATLFEYLQFKELQACRLTCKKWNHLTLPFCRNKFIVEAMTPQSHGKEERESIVKFIKLMKFNTLGNPFAHYRLSPFNPKSPSGQKFIKFCAKSAKGYILHGYPHKIQYVSELLMSSPMLESLELPTEMTSKNGRGTLSRPNIVKLFPGPENTKPKLTFLKFLNASNVLDHNERPHNCPTFYEELFGVAENITTLDLRTLPRGDEVLAAIEKHGHESSIESLRLPGFDDDILETFQRMVAKPNGLKLKHLDFRYTERMKEPFLGEVMGVFKESLISLRLSCPHFKGCGQTIWFPPMPKLKRLEITTKDPVLTRQSFSETFPVLEELKFESSGRIQILNRFKGFINLDGEDSSALKSLSIEAKPMKMKTFTRILTLCPILRKLECLIKDLDGAEVLNKIWTHMTQLEELIIIGRLRRTLNLDSLITGIPVKVIKQIKLTKYSIFDSLGQLDMEARRSKLLILINEHRTLPSIGNLTNLKTLRLNLTTVASAITRPEHLTFLTDITGYLGFYSCKNIRNLHVVNCEFSTSCAEMLVKDNCLMTWKFQPHPRGVDQILPPNLSHDDGKCTWITACSFGR